MISYDGRLYVEAEEHNISVLDNIINALRAADVIIIKPIFTKKALSSIAVFPNRSMPAASTVIMHAKLNISVAA